MLINGRATGRVAKSILESEIIWVVDESGAPVCESADAEDRWIIHELLYVHLTIFDIIF